MRKLLILFCALAILFAFIGCNDKTNTHNETSVPTTNEDKANSDNNSSGDFSLSEFPYSDEPIELPDVELEY